MVAKLASRVLLLSILIGPSLAVAAPPGAIGDCRNRLHDKADPLTNTDAASCFDFARGTYSTASELDNLVQVVAQVVVDKAQQAGWRELERRLLEGARCPDDDHRDRTPLFPAICKVLQTVDIRDILAQPDALLAAAGEDLVNYLAREIAKQANLKPYADAIAKVLLTSSGDAFLTILEEWRVGGPKNVTDRFARDFLARVKAQLQGAATCDGKTSVKASLFVVGMCAIQTGALSNINTCDFEDFLKQCEPIAFPDRVRSIVELSLTALAAKGNARVDAQIRLPFILADTAIQENNVSVPDPKKARELLEAEEDVILGIADSDWVRTASGAIRIAEMIVNETCPAGGKCPDEVENERDGRKKVLAVLGAAGKYAATMKSTATPDEIQAEREQIIKELVARTVNRTSRDHGLVVSLGGNLGLVGGVRVAGSGDAQAAFPVQLGLGLGFQSYHSKTVGFSAMLTALDLGQYVVFDSGNLKVQSPDAASSVILGATVGIWTISRETPFFIGPYGAVSPFLKTTTAKLTYQLGLAVGIYVPLFDFN